MKITVDGWTATVAGEPLTVLPRFDFREFRVRVAEYASVQERQRFLADTFGSDPWLWNTPDELRFDRVSRQLVGAELQVPGALADPDDDSRPPSAPPVRAGGLRADEVRDFRLEVAPGTPRSPACATSTCSTNRWTPASASPRTWPSSSSTAPSSAGA